jgi:hypothetical protein
VNQCSVSATSGERESDQGQRPSPNGEKFKMQQIPPIKITNKGEKYYINRAVDTTNLNQLINEEHDCSVTDDMEIESTQRNDEKNITNNGLTHHQESWKVVTSNKKGK